MKTTPILSPRLDLPEWFINQVDSEAEKLRHFQTLQIVQPLRNTLLQHGLHRSYWEYMRWPEDDIVKPMLEERKQHIEDLEKIKNQIILTIQKHFGDGLKQHPELDPLDYFLQQRYRDTVCEDLHGDDPYRLFKPFEWVSVDVFWTLISWKTLNTQTVALAKHFHEQGFPVKITTSTKNWMSDEIPACLGQVWDNIITPHLSALTELWMPGLETKVLAREYYDLSYIDINDGHGFSVHQIFP